MSRLRRTHNPEWLEAHGYDGLWAQPGPCGCGIGDFAPCGGGPFPECVPAVVGDDGLYYRAQLRRRSSTAVTTLAVSRVEREL